MLALMLLTLIGSTGLADDYPQGCVSCHAATEKQDMRLNVVLAKAEHTLAGQRTLLIPIGCNRCHADDDGVGGALSTLVHRSHYTDPIYTRFVGEYDGDCGSCHKMDTDTGQAEIKSGKRNWTLRIAPAE
jgi:hypothetical protein